MSPTAGPGAELLPIPIPASDRIEIYSGVARLAGKLWASRHRSPTPSRTVVAIVHPSSNFLGHYLLGPLAAAGVDAVGLNTRYIANDSMLIMENCVLDIGAAVARLREEYDRVVLLGNSGGGGLVAMYQSQAEAPTITSTPAGDMPDLTTAALPPVDGLIASMAHPGRAIVYTEWLDPAIADEADPLRRDPTIDMFNEGTGPPYDPDFVSRYRAGQLARSQRIRTWVREQLGRLDGHADQSVKDLPFVVHGTVADLRFRDLTIDASDRRPGTMWGDALGANLSPASLGHHTSLRSWLSQWSIAESNCDGPWHLARTNVPVLVMYGTADQVSFPSHATALYDAVPAGRGTLIALAGAEHYFQSTPDMIPVVADHIVTWLRANELMMSGPRRPA